MNFKILFFIVFVLPCSTYGQNRAIDSLRSILNSELSDSIRIMHQINLANQLTRNDVMSGENSQEAIELATIASEKAKELKLTSLQAKAFEELAYAYDQLGNFIKSDSLYLEAIILYGLNDNQKGISNCWNSVGIHQAIEGNNDSALYIFNLVINLRKELQDSSGLAGAINNVGIIQYRTGNYLAAIDTYHESFDIMEMINDDQGLSEVLTNIGLIHVDRNDYSSAKQYYFKALKYALKVSSKPDLANLYNNIGNLQDQLGEQDSAIYYQQLSFDLYQELNDECGLLYPTIAIGQAYLNKNQLDSARRFLLEGMKKSEACRNIDQMINSYSKMGLIHQASGEMKQAEKLQLKAYNLALETNYNVLLKDMSYGLYRLYRKMNNDSKTLRYLEEYQSLSDSIYSEELKNQSVRLEAEYEFHKEKQVMEHEAEKRELSLMAELNYQYEREFFMLGAILIVCGLLVITWRYSKAKQEANVKLLSLNKDIHSKNEKIESQKAQLETQNEMLSQLNQEKNVLIGVVAHDLRSPLNNIYGLSNLIQLDGDNLTQEQKELLKTMDDATIRLTKMISNVLDVQSIENQEVKLNINTAQLLDVFDKAVSNFKFISAQKNIDIVTELKDKNLSVLVDDIYLLQAIENLLSNAIKFSDANTQVHLSAYQSSDKSVEICIKDQGPGISEEDQKHLFQRYTQLSASPTAGESSTGLGLSIVKKYVEAMNGTVTCQSELGHGTTFVISLPSNN